MSPNTPSQASTGTGLTSVAVDLSGKFAHIVNRQDDTISIYNIDAGTGLLALFGVPVSAGAQPFHIITDCPANSLAWTTKTAGTF